MRNDTKTPAPGTLGAVIPGDLQPVNVLPSERVLRITFIAFCGLAGIAIATSVFEMFAEPPLGMLIAKLVGIFGAVGLVIYSGILYARLGSRGSRALLPPEISNHTIVLVAMLALFAAMILGLVVELTADDVARANAASSLITAVLWAVIIPVHGRTALQFLHTRLWLDRPVDDLIAPRRT